MMSQQLSMAELRYLTCGVTSNNPLSGILRAREYLSPGSALLVSLAGRASERARELGAPNAIITAIHKISLGSAPRVTEKLLSWTPAEGRRSQRTLRPIPLIRARRNAAQMPRDRSISRARPEGILGLRPIGRANKMRLIR